jgi:hypothetical protein
MFSGMHSSFDVCHPAPSMIMTMKEVHHCCFNRGENKGVEYPVPWRDRRIGVGKFLNHPSMDKGTAGKGCPAATGIVDSAKSGFIVKHHAESTAVSLAYYFFSSDDIGESFLNVSCARGSVLGCLLSGASFLHPCRPSRR